MPTLADRIRERRMELGLTQEELARRAGLTQAEIAYLESGRRGARLRLATALLREARRQGWRIEPTKRGHYKAWPPQGGPPVTIPGTPSDWRSIRNVIAMMRRLGFQWKGR